MRKLACMLVLAALPIVAESRVKRVWKYSLGMLAAGAAADVVSSMGKYESNPLVRDGSGRFSPARGVALKTGVCVALYYVGRRHKTVGAVANFTAGGVWMGVAVRNFGVRKAQ